MPLGDGAWEAFIDIDDSVYLRRGEEMVWASELFTYILLKGNDGAMYLVDKISAESDAPDLIEVQSFR